MKLLFSIVEDRVAGKIVDALTRRRFGVTRIDTVGGFLRRGNATLLIGVEDDQIDEAIAVMREAVPERPVPDARGPIFVLRVDQSERM